MVERTAFETGWIDGTEMSLRDVRHREGSFVSPHGHDRREYLYAVPQILEPQIFIGRVLVVVVIDNGEAYLGRFRRLVEYPERDAAAERGRENGPLSHGLLDRSDDLLRDGEVHGSANGAIAVVARHARDEGVLEPRLAVRLIGCDEVALLLDMCDESLDLAARVYALHEAHVHGGGRLGRYYRPGFSAHVFALKPVYVERRLVDQLAEGPASAVGLS